MLFALEFGFQRLLQAVFGGSGGEGFQILLGALLLGLQGLQLLGGGAQGALQLGGAGLYAALGKRGLLRGAFQAALLLAAGRQLALAFDHFFVELGMALLGVGQLHVQLLETAFGRHAAFLQVFQQGVNLFQIGTDLVAAGAHLLSLLRQAQHFHLQGMVRGLAFAGFAAGLYQTLAGIGVGYLGTVERGARLFVDELLGTQFLVQVFDFLGARQQAGLFAVLGVKVDAVGGDGVAGLYVDGFTGLQLRALRQRLIERTGGIAAMQPLGQDGQQARFVHAQQVHHARQRGCAGRARCSRRGIKTQFGRWCIAGKGAHRLQPADLQRAHAFTQGRFQRRFPARLHMQTRPQAMHVAKPVLVQPGRQLAIGFDLFLQCPQRFTPGRQIGLLARFLVQGLLRRATLLIQLRHHVLQLGQACLHDLQLLRTAGHLGLLLQQLGRLRRSQCLAVGQQPFAPLFLLARLLVDAALLGRQHLDLLLHLHHGATLFGRLLLSLAQGILQIGQLHGLLFDLRRQNGCLFFGFHVLGRQRLALGFGLELALVPVEKLLAQLLQALLGTLAVFHHEADFRLQLADLSRGFVQLALRQVDLIARRVMRLADRLQLAFGAAHFRHARFQRGMRGVHIGLDLVLVARRILALEVPQLVQSPRTGLLQTLVFLRHFGLFFQLFEFAVQLAQDVFHACQVLARVVQAVFGFAPALLVLADASCLFQKQAQFFRPALDDAADGALADDGVGARAQAGAQEHVLHVAAPHRLVVDEVAAAAIARQHALDGDLGKLVPLPAGAVTGIVKHQLHAAAAGRLARGGAVEDHVLHGFAAQLAGLAFTQHPAHGIHDVGFAAAVRPDHTHQLPRQHEVGRFGKRLESGKFDRIETHGSNIGRAMPDDVCNYAIRPCFGLLQWKNHQRTHHTCCLLRAAGCLRASVIHESPPVPAPTLSFRAAAPAVCRHHAQPGLRPHQPGHRRTQTSHPSLHPAGPVRCHHGATRSGRLSGYLG